ncbi:MAG TPA: CBS domain-containing protein [Burkholderiaceae bacterium]|nr:CBS domain-containing protein [Burkholderiaceae bacterium]
MHIGEICRRDVVHCTRDTSVAEVAKLMRNHHVGDLIVAEPREGRLVPVGIVTDRDLVVKVLAEEVRPETITAGDLMSPELVTAAETEVLYDAIWHMRSKGIRRLPVVDARNFLVGVLTADDVTRILAEELSEVARIVPRQVKLEQAELAPVDT